MIALKIEDQKTFTSGLFLGNLFDSLLLREASLVTYNSFTIDGRIRSEYYSEEEKEERQLDEYSSWKVLKPFCYSLIRGNRLPTSFRIVFCLSKEVRDEFAARRGNGIRPEDVGGLYLNVQYENGVMSVVTGASLLVFTPDKSLIQAWDESTIRYLKQQGIAVSEY